MLNPTNPQEIDRVRRYTPTELLEKIDREIEHNIRFYAAQPDYVIQERIETLKREWSIERYLQINIATVGLSTVLLALTGNRKWGLLTCVGLGFFLYHAVEGFDPPIPLLRKLGLRTRREIDRELFALKAVRGDFKRVPTDRPEPVSVPAEQVLEAIDR